MLYRGRREVANKSLRIGMNILARSIRSLMRVNGAGDYFCVGADDAYYCWNGLRRS
jgi:hypothetical protein